jgi:transcriptional regulator with XRE-family HTH domain
MKTLEIGERIRTLRERLGFTQEQLSERAGIANRALQRLEGEGGNPTISTLMGIAKALGCDASVLLGTSENPMALELTATQASMVQTIAFMQKDFDQLSKVVAAMSKKNEELKQAAGTPQLNDVPLSEEEVMLIEFIRKCGKANRLAILALTDSLRHAQEYSLYQAEHSQQFVGLFDQVDRVESEDEVEAVVVPPPKLRKR